MRSEGRPRPRESAWASGCNAFGTCARGYRRLSFGPGSRALKTDANPLLFVTNMGAGHGGASGRYDRLREIALDYAFMIQQVAPEAAVVP